MIYRHSVFLSLGVFSSVPRFCLLGFQFFPPFLHSVIPPFNPSTVPRSTVPRSIVLIFLLSSHCCYVFRLRIFGCLTLTLCRNPNSRIRIIWFTSCRIRHFRLLFDILIGCPLITRVRGTKGSYIQFKPFPSPLCLCHFILPAC